MSGLTDAEVAFDWHDATCPEGADCRSRFLHATTGGGMVLPIVERIVAARVAEAVEQERAARLALVAKIEASVEDGMTDAGDCCSDYCVADVHDLRLDQAERLEEVLRALLDDTKATS